MKGARGTAVVVAVALAARLAIAVWAFDRIPPIADGTYYDIIARRISDGHGYTWAWPDGTVTFAAHYPIGYPALVALAYLVGGAAPGSAMVMNAILGALGAGCVHRAALRVAPAPVAFAGALLGFALHPALVSYTPALMTEGVSAAFVAAMLWAAVRMSDRGAGSIALLGAVTGLATLVRPQLLVLGPLLALAAAMTPRPRPTLMKLGLFATACLAVSLLVVAPWTARNCARMSRCALVSVNGGWNLLIGTDRGARGTWAPVIVPDACFAVTDEAEKDACFARAGKDAIARDPAGWLGLAPSKLQATFNHIGAGPWYLHDANPDAFPTLARTVAGLLEAIYQRILVALVLVASTAPRLASQPRPVRIASAITAAFVGLAAPGWLGVLAAALAAAVAAFVSAVPRPEARAFALTAAVILATAVTHVVFFGAGRYALVIVPALVLAALPAARLLGELRARVS